MNKKNQIFVCTDKKYNIKKNANIGLPNSWFELEKFIEMLLRQQACRINNYCYY